MAQGLSPQLQEKIKKYQELQQKISSAQQQVQSLKMDEVEVNKALKEIEDMPDDEMCYRSIGRIMVKSNIKETKQKLTDQKELIETRIELSQKSQKKLQKQYQDLEEDIKSTLESQQKGSS
ncbi:MAG: prefoldin subunit beta [Asgard group archaeon]|nr:prefoldin subunit beta [Asgard group archaeon]